MKTDTQIIAPAKEGKPGLFVVGGRNLVVTFCLVSSLFLLWGFGNGMIDTMDKHFQKELHLSLSQSAWVQFAHYFGYFLMSLPAGWLATRLGYKWGIVAGLCLVAGGGLWFIPATGIAQFWAFLLGVCAIAAGFTFLETVANPYTTVLGPERFAASRINLAQSCNGMGWLLGPIAGALFFYGEDETGKSTGSQTLWIPYAGIAVVVIILIVAFFFAYVPNLDTRDAYGKGKEGEGGGEPGEARRMKRGLNYMLLVANAGSLTIALGMILYATLAYTEVGQYLTGIASALPHPSSLAINNESALALTIAAVGCIVFLVAAAMLIKTAKTISEESFWSHPHFGGATVAQFLYVAAQAGIFSFFINYMTSEPPPIPDWMNVWIFKKYIFMTGKDGFIHISDAGASILASAAFFCFLLGRVSGSGLLAKFPAHTIVGLYGVLNVGVCFLIFFKLGWLSVAGVFLSYFFMSIMFPTIFALGIHGLGVKAKKASAYIVMGIMGGAILPKAMGAVGDHYGMSKAFIVPMVCFVLIAMYGFCWPILSGAKSLHAATASGHH